METPAEAANFVFALPPRRGRRKAGRATNDTPHPPAGTRVAGLDRQQAGLRPTKHPRTLRPV
jgi:hypothetical protein